MDLDNAHQRITLICDALTAAALLGTLDLGLKHPLHTGPSATLVRAFREQLCHQLAQAGLFNAEDIKKIFRAEEIDISRHEAQQRLRDEWAR